MFWCDRSLLDGDRVTLTGAEGRHATTVRRMRPGERVDLTDGAGLIAECEVVAARPGPGELDLAVLARRTEPEPASPITVVQAILKGDRGELAVELMTEVGADVIVPWAAQRCVARWAPGREDKALARWRSAAMAAGKQARRGRFSDVTPQERLAAISRRVSEAALAVLLDPSADKPLTGLPLPAAGEIVLIVGPEGGLTEAEDAALTAAGAVRARLGPTVLRGSTAGAVATALVLSASGRWAWHEVVFGLMVFDAQLRHGGDFGRLCVGDAEALSGFTPPVPAFWRTCDARVACAVALEVPGLWVCWGGEDEALGEVDGEGDGDGLGDVLGDVGVAVGDGLELGELDGVPDGVVLGGDGLDEQLGDDVLDVLGPVPPGSPLLPVVPVLAEPEVD